MSVLYYNYLRSSYRVGIILQLGNLSVLYYNYCAYCSCGRLKKSFEKIKVFVAIFPKVWYNVFRVKELPLLIAHSQHYMEGLNYGQDDGFSFRH